MNTREMSVCPVHPIVDVTNEAETAAVDVPARQYALRIAIGESLYQKLVAAHQKVRSPDGSRLPLRTLLELAMDSLLNESRNGVGSVERRLRGFVPEEEPLTVRAPLTVRWDPAMKS